MRDDKGRIQDILDAISCIEKYTSKGGVSDREDELVETWVIHHLQIIGEAARGLSKSLQKKYKGVPWAEIVGMRNILVHHYFGIETDEVWSTIENDLPDLKRKIFTILKALK